MCERHGNSHSNLLALSRRGFLKTTGIAGASVALPAGIAAALASGPALADTTIKATHGSGLCNLGFFLAKKRELAKADGVNLDFVITPTNADIATLFGAGQVDMSVIPYSNFLTLYDAGAPVKIIAGAGVEGCILIAKEGIRSAADLKGKTLGTFQADTLEVLPYDYLKKAGLSFKDVQVRYFNTSPELAQAFIAGGVDAICHIEPYATQCLASRKGSTVLSDGRDIYAKHYSDCVLAARTPLIEKNPQAVKAVIKAMFVAQGQAETDPDAALRDTVGTYYKTTFEAAKLAASKQPIMVDQRNNTQFILDRAQSMKELGYVKKLAPRQAIDWTLLEQVIAQNKPLYDSLKLKTVA
ncbi:MAG TPA: ABC transporter substrate-binding protein [Albitalea sp.]|nr:ABC transporter substrate-binding protein [Albitalea sp.]